MQNDNLLMQPSYLCFPGANHIDEFEKASTVYEAGTVLAV